MAESLRVKTTGLNSVKSVGYLCVVCLCGHNDSGLSLATLSPRTFDFVVCFPGKLSSWDLLEPVPGGGGGGGRERERRTHTHTIHLVRLLKSSCNWSALYIYIEREKYIYTFSFLFWSQPMGVGGGGGGAIHTCDPNERYPPLWGGGGVRV